MLENERPDGRTVDVYLKGGNVTGLRKVDVWNWSGLGLVCPVKKLPALTRWYSDISAHRTGIYFLVGGELGSRTIYVGQSEDVLSRLGNHVNEKKFWSEAVIFTNKDDILTTAHGKWLESKLLERLEKTGRAEIQNERSEGAPNLSPGARSLAQGFLHHIRLVLGTLGYRFLEFKEDGEEVDRLSGPLQMSAKGATAQGKLTDEGFIVFKGSEAASQSAKLRPHAAKEREELIEDGILEKDPESGQLKFQKKYHFSSSSLAASVVAASTRSGPRMWEDEEGKSLKTLQQEAQREAADAVEEE